MGLSSVLVNLGARLFTANRTLLSFWARRAKVLTFPDTPWTPLRRPVRECRVAMVTTAGVHLRSDRPFDMRDRRGDPSFREIPSDAAPSDLTITHDYYDHRDADRDVNVVFPVDRLREMAREGAIGGLAPRFYSFMGHVEGPHLETLIRGTSVEVARRLAGDVDLALLTPA